jgi:2-polyprenyl-6-methoxyphenol hydroxylase-like FAD-dependent oxidoreductase
VQDGLSRYAHPSGRLLLLAAAAHPMVPTLGQGATQAIEDACVAAKEMEAALDAGKPFRSVPDRVANRRTERVQFVSTLSREASDTMLRGADPVAGAAWKQEAGFQRSLERLYRDAPSPSALPAHRHALLGRRQTSLYFPRRYSPRMAVILATVVLADPTTQPNWACDRTVRPYFA